MNNKSSDNQSNIEELSINTIRTLSIDAIQKANSGHPGAPMGLAPTGYVLWKNFLKFNPKNPQWFNRDRFVLSGGHASMLLYSLLYLSGFDISLDDLKKFRNFDSITPGHPEYGITPGVETTTGPLGQGFANAVGMAMAERFLANIFNKPDFEIVDHHTFVFCGDGDMMEGISGEAASLAGHLGLNKLICMYDYNKISIEGPTDITFTEDVSKRFEAYGWYVLKVDDGNNTKLISEAISQAMKNNTKPSLIIVKTHIGFGSPNKQDTAGAHGSPLGEDEIIKTKEFYGFPTDKFFYIPDGVLEHFNNIENGKKIESEWNMLFEQYCSIYPDMAKKWHSAMNNKLEENWDKDIINFNNNDPIATRAASGKILNSIADKIPTLIGGSADLAPSNNTFINSSIEFQKNQYNGKNIRFGVREHAMGAILNGMAVHRGIKVFGGTFLVFSDYMRPSIRMASLMKIPVTYVFTHDSIAVGEDGPTHQPVEHIACLRAIPNLTLIRPGDAIETVYAWRYALIKNDGPTALILSRQKLPVIKREKHIEENISKGAYILMESKKKPDIIIIASGSELDISIKAFNILVQKGIGIRLVSMPCWEIFDLQEKSYIDEVLPSSIKYRIVVEAGLSMGWRKYAGENSSFICMNDFGRSGPGDLVCEYYGFTPENIVSKVLKIVN